MYPYQVLLNMTNGTKVLSNKRKKFTKEEDERLKYIIFSIGSYNWNEIAEHMPERTAKQCRDRFFNYLSETYKEEPWSKEEDAILLKLLPIVGPKWVTISRYIIGRSGNDVKNRWHRHLKKNYFYSKERQMVFQYKTNDENIMSEPKERNQEENIEINNLQRPYSKYDIQSLLV